MSLENNSLLRPSACASLLGFLLFCLPATRILAVPQQEMQQYRESDALQLELSVSGQRCFVGEGIVLELRWRSRLPWQSYRDVELDLPLLASRSFEHYDFESRPAEWEEVGMPLANTRVLAYVSPARRNEDWRTIRLFKVLVPRKAGVYRIDGVELRCAVLPRSSSLAQDWGRYPSYFDNNFFEREVPAAASLCKVAAAPLQLEVEALPPGSSIQNTLAVCTRFEASIEAGPRSVAVGDPIELRLRIAGDAIPESVKRPQLDKLLSASGLEVDPRAATPEYEEGAVVFRYLLRAASDEVERIPPLKLEYFDRNSKAYRHVETEAVPLEVSPAPTIGIEDAVRARRGFGGKTLVVLLLVSLLVIAATVFIVLRSRRAIS